MYFTPPPRGAVSDPDDLHRWMGVDEGKTVVDLIHAGSLSPRLVAILWSLLARRASIIVAAMPRLAGKSTTLAALLDLLPPDTLFYPIGSQFSREAVRGLPPERTRLVVNEISEHIPTWYLWGEGVRELFQARAEGYPFAATLHAWSPEGVFEELLMSGLGLDEGLLRGIDLVLVLRGVPQQGRGAESLTIRLDAEAPSGGARADGEGVLYTLADWDPGQRTFRYQPPETVAALLSRWSGETPERMAEEIESREAYLTGLAAHFLQTMSLRDALARSPFA
jgi:hypothetical protein